jgi:hypothetical protein
MKRFSLRLSEAEYQKLKTYCDFIKVSMNDTVRQIIREWEPEIFILKESEKKEKSI